MVRPAGRSSEGHRGGYFQYPTMRWNGLIFESPLITHEGASFAQIKPIVPLPLPSPRQPGIDEGRLIVPDDIMEPLPDSITEAVSSPTISAFSRFLWIMLC